MVLSRRRARRSRRDLPLAEGKAKVAKSTYLDKTGGLQAAGHAEEAGRGSTDVTGMGFENRSLPAPPPPLSQRPPAPVPHTSVVSMGQQQAPPLPAERQSPLATSTHGSSASQQGKHRNNRLTRAETTTDNYIVAGQGMDGGVASRVGGGKPSQPHPAYMKVIDPEIEGEEKLYEDVELYEDVDRSVVEGSYLTADEVHGRYNLNSNDAYTMANDDHRSRRNEVDDNIELKTNHAYIMANDLQSELARAQDEVDGNIELKTNYAYIMADDLQSELARAQDEVDGNIELKANHAYIHLGQPNAWTS